MVIPHILFLMSLFICLAVCKSILIEYHYLQNEWESMLKQTTIEQSIFLAFDPIKDQLPQSITCDTIQFDNAYKMISNKLTVYVIFCQDTNKITHFVKPNSLVTRPNET